MPDKTIRMSSVKPGDVVIFHGATGVAAGQAIAQALKYAAVLPALASAARTGSAGLTGNLKASHVGMVTTGGMNAQYAHATLKTLSVADLTNGVSTFKPERVQTAFPWIYRPTSPALGQAAAEVATTWTQPGKGMAYSVSAAGYSVFGSSSYGSGAKVRAQVYRMARRIAGGVPAAFGCFSSTFCSAFVIACYQACMTEAQTVSSMALDAINTSPATLQGFLSSRAGWTYEGRLLLED